MPLGPVEQFVFSLIDLLKGSLIAAVPVFILVLAGRFLREKISGKKKHSWLLTALASTFAILWVLLLFAYFSPFLESLSEAQVGVVPSPFAPPAASILASYIAGIVKVTIAAFVASLLLMPLELVGLFILEWLSAKFPKNSKYLNLFAATYATTIIASAVLLFIVPEALQGFIYYFYFG